MLKTVRDMAIGIIASVAFGAIAFAAGVPPISNGGPALIDQTWVQGVANGQNASYIYGISAAGSTQATSTQLNPGNTLIEVDTVSASTGVALPPAIQGTEISIYNSTGTTLTVYPSIVNNGVTAAQDTINNGTSVTISGHSSGYFFCAKNGIWAEK